MDWLDLLAVQGTQESSPAHSLKAMILQGSAFFMAQLSQPYITTGEIIALMIQIFVGKVMSLLSTLSRFVLAFLQRNKYLNFMVCSHCP